jgi:3-hydroxymyristoyl/3-hydroxydecanoyl-(acyl carrier protein) dehydratase
VTSRVESVLGVSADHPAFDGHFPGRPILPGVVLLAEVIASLEKSGLDDIRNWILDSAKFHDAVAPATPLTLVHEVTGRDKIRFEVRSANGLVANGSFRRCRDGGSP